MRAPPPTAAPIIPSVANQSRPLGDDTVDDEVQLVDGPVRAFAETPETLIHPRASQAPTTAPRKAPGPHNATPRSGTPDLPAPSFQPKFDPEVIAWAEHPSKMSKQAEEQLISKLSPEYRELLQLEAEMMEDDEAELHTCGGTVIVKL